MPSIVVFHERHTFPLHGFCNQSLWRFPLGRPKVRNGTLDCRFGMTIHIDYLETKTLELRFYRTQAQNLIRGTHRLIPVLVNDHHEILELVMCSEQGALPYSTLIDLT